MRNGEAMGKGSGIRRLRRRIRHLPTWSKAAALALVGVVAFFGVAIGMGAAAHASKPSLYRLRSSA